MWFFKEGYWKTALMVSAIVSILWLMIPHKNNLWLWGVEEVKPQQTVIECYYNTITRFGHEFRGEACPQDGGMLFTIYVEGKIVEQIFYKKGHQPVLVFFDSEFWIKLAEGMQDEQA